MKKLATSLIASALLLGASACSQDPNLKLAETQPVNAVLELIYGQLLQLEPVGGRRIAERALRRADLSIEDQSRLEFALAVTFENYQPKSDGMIQAAQELFRKVAERSPELAPKAILHIARSYEVHLSKPEPESAVVQYKILLEKYPESEVAAEATLRLGQNLLWRSNEAQRRRGREVLDAFLAAHPGHELAVAMHLALADAAVCREQYDDAVEHLIAAYEGGILPYKRRWQALYQIGNIAYLRLNRMDIAEKYYTIAVRDYWNTSSAFEAKKRIEEIRAKRAAGEPAPSAEGKG